MSDRLGAALAEHLRRHLVPGQRNFVLVEGVPASVADGMRGAWDDDSMPRLAIASRTPQRFGRYALADISGTQLRNQPGTRGVVLVFCDGEQVPDRQSLTLFQSVSPSDLLDSPEGVAILAQQAPAVRDLDGPGRAVRTAIVQAGPAARPSALAVASYLDRVAAGEDPLHALPAIGGFVDAVPAGADIDSGRILDNLGLASRSTSEEVLRPAAYADLRKRAERVLAQRPVIAGGNEYLQVADEVMSQLQAGSPALLETLRFDEAREILEQRSENLAAVVRREIGDFRAGLLAGSQAEQLPWHLYEKRADELGRGPTRRSAAKELSDLDDAQQRAVFTKPTRAKLEKQQRDKSVNGSSPSCPEAAIVRAAQQLGGLIQRVQVLSPYPPVVNSAAASNRSGAGRILTLASARLRLGGLMHDWDQWGGEVDGLLLRSADDDDLGGPEGVLAAFGDAALSDGAPLPPLQLRLHADDKSTVQVDWRPDLDDAALVRAALLFAEAPTLTLAVPAEPTLHNFCGTDTAPPRPIPKTLTRTARALQATARNALDRGLSPTLLSGWTQAWTRAVADREGAGDTADAEALALAGAVRNEGSAALTGFAPLKAEWLAQYIEALWKLVNKAEEPGDDAEPGDAVAAAAGIARTTAAHYPAHLRLETQDRALLPSSEGRVWSLTAAGPPEMKVGSPVTPCAPW